MVAPDIEMAWSRFQRAARRYCAVIDAVTDINDSETLYREIGQPLAELYAAGLELPSVPPTDDDFEVEDLGLERWWEIFKMIDRLTSDEDPYRTIVDPDEDTECIEAALAMDLTDIYVDIYPATEGEDSAHLRDRLWELRFAFQSNWGLHALEAMRVMYWRNHRYW